MTVPGQLHQRDIVFNLYLGIIFAVSLIAYWWGVTGNVPTFGINETYIKVFLFFVCAYTCGMVFSNIYYRIIKRYAFSKSSSRVLMCLKSVFFGFSDLGKEDLPPFSFGGDDETKLKTQLLKSCIKEVFKLDELPAKKSLSGYNGLIMPYIKMNGTEESLLDIERQRQFFNFYSRLFTVALLFELLTIVLIVAKSFFSPIKFSYWALAWALIFWYIVTRISGTKFQDAFKRYRGYSWQLFIIIVVTQTKREQGGQAKSVKQKNSSQSKTMEEGWQAKSQST